MTSSARPRSGSNTRTTARGTRPNEVAHLAAGGLTLAFENRFRARDGSYRTLSWTAVPVEGLLYCVTRDVTLEKERAETLPRPRRRCRQSQKLEAVGQLTGGVAHDFNNLLTVIKSSTDLLKRPDLTEDRRVRYIAAISDTVDRAAKLTGQLLAFAGASSAAGGIRRRPEREVHWRDGRDPDRGPHRRLDPGRRRALPHSCRPRASSTPRW